MHIIKSISKVKNKTLIIDYSKERAMLCLFLAPAIVFILFANIYPLSYAFIMSFFQYNRLIPGSVPVFIGLRNYIDLVRDPTIVSSFVKTILYVSITVMVEFLIGVALALLVTTTVRGIQFIRGFFLIPLMIPPVVAGTLWRTLYNSLYGPIDYFLTFLGFTKVEWLGNTNLALPSVMLVEIWQQTPIVVFIIAAGIQALPIDIYLAAQVDGASKWQILKRITLPLLKPVFSVALLLRVMDAFRVFDT
ncbi:MAG: sugar ABC transporter permease, partial [Actinobacteria bacterium]|nr:sugar ABC transporter permease [Actinomycetota bacterium]